MAKIKKSKNKSPDVYEEVRHLGVTIENVNDGVKLITEQYGDIKKTLGSHSKKLDAHTEMIGRLAVDMAIVKEDLEFIKGGLKKKVDNEEFIALERRVALLERRR